MSYDFIADRYDDIIGNSALRTVGANAPSLVSWQPGGSGGLFLYEFVSNQRKELFFQIQVPHRIKYASQIFPHVHFTTRTTTATGIVRWQMEYSVAAVGGTFGAPSTIGGSYTFAANNQDKHLVQSIDSATITLPASSYSAIIVGRLFRDGGVSPDTYADSVYLLGFDFHAVQDKHGSVAEFG